MRDNGSLPVGERLKRIELEIDDMRSKIRNLELNWAKATGIIVAVMVALKFVPWGC